MHTRRQTDFATTRLYNPVEGMLACGVRNMWYGMCCNREEFYLEPEASCPQNAVCQAPVCVCVCVCRHLIYPGRLSTPLGIRGRISWGNTGRSTHNFLFLFEYSTLFPRCLPRFSVARSARRSPSPVGCQVEPCVPMEKSLSTVGHDARKKFHTLDSS